MLTILAMSVQNAELSVCPLTGNHGNFHYVEFSTAWFFDSLHFVSPLNEADECFDRIP